MRLADPRVITDCFRDIDALWCLSNPLFFSLETSGFLLSFFPFFFLFVTAFDRKPAAVIPVTAVANIQLDLHIQSDFRRVKSIPEFLYIVFCLGSTRFRWPGSLPCSKPALVPWMERGHSNSDYTARKKRQTHSFAR